MRPPDGAVHEVSSSEEGEHSPERVRRNLLPLKAKKAAAKAATKRKAPQGGEKVAAAAKKRAGASDMEADDDGLAIFAQHARPATATHSRTPTTGKPGSTPMRAAPPPPPRPSGDLLPGAEVVQAEAGK